MPTEDQIAREVLHLDHYGMIVSGLVAMHPVDLGRHVEAQDIMDDLTVAFEEEGWELSGSGYFSAVFVKEGMALKVGFKPTDTGAMYAAWCRANQGKPGVPTVYALSKFEGCYVVLTRAYRSVETDLEYGGDRSKHYLEFNAIRQSIKFGHKRILEAPFATADTALEIHEFFNGIVEWDMHEGNVMVDSDDRMVITDPMSYGPCSSNLGVHYYTYES